MAIAIGSVIGRLISKCAAATASTRFQRLFQPPIARSCASRPRHQTDGAPWPSQVGVCCRNGSELASHAILALLDSHPSFVDVALDIRNAFNSILRGAFLPIVASHFPDLLHTVG